MVVADLPFRKVYQKVGSSRVFDLVIEKDGQAETHPSLIWDVQAHPWKNQVSHVDFYGIDPKKPIHVHVAVVFTGKAKGVGVGGKLEIYRESIEVVCLPASIPEKIVIDVTELELNQHVSAKDLVMPEGVKAVFDKKLRLGGASSNPADETEDEAEKTAGAAPAK